MFSESGSFCFMGVSSNSPVFLSEKDPKPRGGGNNNINIKMDPEFGLRVVRPAKETHKEECQTSTPEGHPFIRLKKLSVQELNQQPEEDKDHQEEEQNQRDNDNIIVPAAAPLKLKKLEIPSHVGVSEMNDGGGDDDSNEDGFKTPTSSDHKIPAILECPGAPRRRTKTRRPATKRKAASCRRRLVFDFDLSKEIESLLPTTPFMVDLGSGDENKKVKRCSRD